MCSLTCHALWHADREALRLGARDGDSHGVIVPIRVTRVIDGDTVVDSHDVHYRMAHMDAPEHDQQGGTGATAHLRTLLARARGNIGVRMLGHDRFRRVLGELVVLDADGAVMSSINEAMVRDGWAWAYDRKSPSEAHWRELEQQAHGAKRGLWGLPGTPMLPHNFRHLPPEERAKLRVSNAQ